MSHNKNQRQLQLAEYIKNNKQVSMKALPSIFKVSMNTIRADIDDLTNTGVIKKVYGGVEYNNPDYFTYQPIPGRIEENSDNKKNLCQIAVAEINDGDVIYIDYGTTTQFIPDFLNTKKNITVITPNFYAISKLAMQSETKLIMLPGEYNYPVAGVMSENTIQDISNYHFTKAFLACTGIDLSLNITSTSYFQRQIKQMVIKQSDKCYLVAESTKFNCSGLLYYGNLSEFEAVITDRNIPDYIRSLLDSKEIRLLTD